MNRPFGFDLLQSNEVNWEEVQTQTEQQQLYFNGEPLLNKNREKEPIYEADWGIQLGAEIMALRGRSGIGFRIVGR